MLEHVKQQIRDMIGHLDEQIADLEAAIEIKTALDRPTAQDKIRLRSAKEKVAILRQRCEC